MRTLVLAKGELWLHADGAAARQITSAFAREVIERDERSRRTSSWKHAPRMADDGTLYAIRRPVDKPVGERAGNALVDTLMMPVRLLSALFGFLNVFTTVYGKEPLRSAGGPRTAA